MRRLFSRSLTFAAGALALLVAVGVVLFVAYNRNLYTDEAAPGRKTTVVEGGTLFDGTGNARQEDARIVVEQGRISCVGSDCRIPENAKIIDASGLAVLPAFTDLHVHFTAPVEDYNTQLSMGESWSFLRGRPSARRAFHGAGVTTIRSVGDPVGSPRWSPGNPIDILRLEKRVESGALAGPKIYTTGPIFTAPRGHPVGTLFRNNKAFIETAARQVDDARTAREEVRKLARQGVDGIKAVYDDGPVSGTIPRLKPEVLNAVTEEAHSLDLWVAVHTNSPEEVSRAVQAGADTIEHGALESQDLDQQTISTMRERGVVYVPTLAVAEEFSQQNSTFRQLFENALSNLEKVAEGDVKIGVGTDTQGAGMAFGESFHRELRLLVRAGLTPEEALLAATRNAAQALRTEDQFGTIEEGKRADLLLVEGRPWEDVSAVENVHTVVQEGRVVVGGGSSPAGE